MTVSRRYGRKLLLVFIPALMLLPAALPAAGTKAVRPLDNRHDSLGVGLFLAEIQRDNNYLAQAQTGKTKTKPRSIDMNEPETVDEKYREKKSPFRAFVYSAIIPGAGQYYNGSKVKAMVFFGIEALTWTGHIVYHGKGEDKTTEFENFADIHWSENRYGDFLFSNWQVRDDDSVLDAYGNSLFTHHLPDTKTQQYYEMIGKYDQFVFGWDDVDTVATPPTRENITEAYSANRMHYEDMRHKANQMFDRATASLIATMANHLISGVEAALAAKSHNKKVKPLTDRLSFRAVTAEINDNHFPMLTMTYRF